MLGKHLTQGDKRKAVCLFFFFFKLNVCLGLSSEEGKSPLIIYNASLCLLKG